MTSSKKLKSATSKTTNSNLKVGAHLSIAGGYANAVLKTEEIGGNCLQIFSSSPRVWAKTEPTQNQITNFLDLKAKLSIDPIYFHASYLINLADSGRVGDFSIQNLTQELDLAKKMGIKGSIVHLGSFKGGEKNYTQLFRNIQAVLQKTPKQTLLIIENAGNKKLCCELDELAFIVSELRDERIKICLDTCHLWAGGYDLSTKEKYKKYFSEFSEKIGTEKLEVLQINDSKDNLGSYRDRHENLGQGNIPMEEFRLIVNENETKNLPLILEVPGFNKQGPDRQNLEILKNLSK